MKYRRIVLAGGHGYLGRVLAGYYRSITEEIIILSRKAQPDIGNIKTIIWDGAASGPWLQSLDGADLLVNLCGKNVNCRYTEENRKEIIRSRVIPTKLLGSVIRQMENPPRVWINVTSATIYRHAEDEPQDEEKGEIGYGFSIDVCRRWEDAFFNTETPLTRKIALRMGIVLGRTDGVFPRLLSLVKCGFGGKQGDGRQYISWIHEQDAARCTEWLMLNEHVRGVINCTAPEAVKNKDFMSFMRQACGIPFGLPSPAWLLNIGAQIIRTEPELILKSRWVQPEKLLNNGYKFLFSKAEYAIKDILSIRV